MSSSMKKTDGYVGVTDLFKVDPRKIVIESGWNPRTLIDTTAESFLDLKESLRHNGFRHDKPLVLYRRGADLILRSGHRRHRAAMMLIDEGVPFLSVFAVLDQSGDPAEQLVNALASNQNSEPLEPTDEARAFRRLTLYGWEPKHIAQKVGRSVSHVYGRLKLLEAEPDVLQAAQTKAITTSDAVRVVEQSGRNGVPQSTVLAETIKKRQAKKAASSGWSSPDKISGADERTMRRFLDDYGVAWAMRIVLDYADKSEVLDCIHEIAEGVA